MKGYFDKHRSEILSAYGRELKKRYPECRYKNTTTMQITFPRKNKFKSLDLDDYFNDQEYYSWHDRHTESAKGKKTYEYIISIFPKDTMVFKLNWLTEEQLPATDKQIEAIYKLMILHMEYNGIPYNIYPGKILSRRRATDIITALIANKHVALVLDFEWRNKPE